MAALMTVGVLLLLLVVLPAVSDFVSACLERRAQIKKKEPVLTVSKLASRAGVSYSDIEAEYDWFAGHLELCQPEVKSDLDIKMKEVANATTKHEEEEQFNLLDPQGTIDSALRGQEVRGVRGDVRPVRPEEQEVRRMSGIPVKYIPDDGKERWIEHECGCTWVYEGHRRVWRPWCCPSCTELRAHRATHR